MSRLPAKEKSYLQMCFQYDHTLTYLYLPTVLHEHLPYQIDPHTITLEMIQTSSGKTAEGPLFSGT